MPVQETSTNLLGQNTPMESASDLLLAEFIHRAANDWAVACAEVNIASRLPSLAAMRDRLEITASRLHALTSIQRLLQTPRSGVIDINSALYDLCQYQAEARFADQGAFIRLRACEGLIDAERGAAFLMIVSELLTNAARHAFDGPGGLIEVDVARLGDTMLCRISDNGIGAADARKGRTGTALVSALARKAGIGFSMPDSATGTRFDLSLPCITDRMIGSRLGD